MLASSRVRRFYKPYKDRHWTNPLRRWVIQKIVGGGVVAFFLFFPYSYWRAWMAAEDGNSFASMETITFLELFPLNFISRMWGAFADYSVIPISWHHKFIQWFIYLYSIKFDGDLTEYDTLQQFFCRRDFQLSSANVESSVLVAPCAGRVLQIGEVENDEKNTVIQVKGCEYSLKNLFRTELPRIPSGKKRVYTVFHIPLSNNHWFFSPAKMEVSETNQISGTLFPAAEGAMKWIPRLYVSNERLNIIGKRSNSSNDPPGFVGISCIGSLCRGNIKLTYDQRFETNVITPSTFVVRQRYEDRACQMERVDELGYFQFGSAIVVVADIPSTDKFALSRNDMVKVGDPIVVPSGEGQ